MKDSVNHPLYLSIRRLVRIPVKIIFRLKGFRVIGGNHLPLRRMPAMLICNHAAFVDSVYLIAAVRPRFVICGAKPKYFEKKMMGFLLRTANILKVENEAQFRKDCAALLAAGDIILIYPEMGRNPDGMGPFRTWAAAVALEAAVPVIPCCLYGTAKGQEGPKRLYAGPAIKPAGDAESLTRIFRKAVEGLCPEKEIP